MAMVQGNINASACTRVSNKQEEIKNSPRNPAAIYLWGKSLSIDVCPGHARAWTFTTQPTPSARVANNYGVVSRGNLGTILGLCGTGARIGYNLVFSCWRLLNRFCSTCNYVYCSAYSIISCIRNYSIAVLRSYSLLLSPQAYTHMAWLQNISALNYVFQSKRDHQDINSGHHRVIN